MARRVRASTLENRTARLKLEPRKKPYHFTVIAPGIAVGYRRCQGPGRWVLRAANGHGAYWTDTIALADDHEPADGAAVLHVLAGAGQGPRPGSRRGCRRRPPGHRGGCARRLRARSGDARRPGRQCARRPQADPRHAAGQAGRPADFPRAAALARRPARRAQGVVGQPHCKSLKAALNLAAAHDPRIGNSAVWRNALAGLPDAHTARHVGLPERDVRAIVAAAYAVAPSLGLWTEIAATTGARPSQIARLDVADLQDESRRSAPDDAVVEKGQGPQARRAPPGADPAGTGGQAADGRRKATCRRCAADHSPTARAGGADITSGRLPAAAQAGLAGVTAYRAAPLIDHPCVAGRRADPSGRGHARHLRGDDGDATTAPTFSITPTRSAGARCSTWRCSHEPWRPVPLPVEGPGWIPYAAALKAAIDRFQSTPLAIAKLDSAFKHALSAARSKALAIPRTEGIAQ